MKFSTAFTTVLAIVPAITGASAGVVPRQNNQRKGGNNNPAVTNPQTSFTLDTKVIATGFSNNGQDVPTEGQVASLTSSNNFINFCLTVPNLPITNGKQIETGSCNPAPIGVIPSVDKMPSSKFTNPKNGDVISANVPFTIRMAIQNLQTGAFVNAQQNYFSAPQQLNGAGTIIGHSHVVVEQLTSLSQTTPTDPKKFAFFKGLNGVAANGILSADVASGLPAGAYRLCSINASANHQPVIAPIAQHGSLDDCIYFTAGNANTSGNVNAGGAAATTQAATPATTKANNEGNNGANGNRGGRGRFGNNQGGRNRGRGRQ